jgi:hypothetical protein
MEEKELVEKEKTEEEIVDDLQKEINSLEKEIDTIEKTNFKKAVIKNVKLTGKFLRKWVPILVVGVTFSLAYNGLVAKPFQRQPIKAPAYTRTTQDSLGNIDVYKQYTSFSSTQNYVDVTSPWEKNDDGYSQTVKRYYLNEENTKMVLDVLNGNLVASFDSIFSVPNAVAVNTSNHLTEEELNNKETIKVVFFDEDKNDTIVRQTELTEEIGITLVYLMGILLVECLALAALENDRNKCDSKIREIKENYQPLYTEPLKKELKLKREECNKLITK